MTLFSSRIEGYQFESMRKNTEHKIPLQLFKHVLSDAFRTYMVELSKIEFLSLSNG